MLGRVGGLTVRARLILLGGTLSVLLAVVAIVAVTGVSSIKSAYNADQIPGNNRDVAHAAYEGWLQSDDQMNMYAAVQSLHNPANDALAKATWAQLIQGRQIEDKNLAQLKTGHLTPKQAAIFRQITTTLPAYNSWPNKMYATLKDINSLSGTAATNAIALGVKDISVSNANVSNLMGNLYNKLSNQLGDDEDVISARIPATVNSTLTLSLVIGIVALVLAGLITFLIIRSITRPLAKVAEAADRVAEGRVDVELDLHGRDEISKVAESFRAVIAHLKTMADATREFANGHLNVNVVPKSDGDVLGHAFVDLRDQMQDALGEKS
ncbi:MAG TPA: HAMP domain-containing protein, partial [Solirubrobacteraceae bacterium]|nr:HAMP domain-containing protein [Solirubrobacteraceae bacterium]